MKEEQVSVDVTKDIFIASCFAHKKFKGVYFNC